MSENVQVFEKKTAPPSGSPSPGVFGECDISNRVTPIRIYRIIRMNRIGVHPENRKILIQTKACNRPGFAAGPP